MDGSLPFTNTFEEYKRVFGQLCSKNCNYFLGNENLYQLLQSYGTTECELRIELYDFGGGGMRWLVAKQIRMNNESLKYSLNWDEVISPYPELGVDCDFYKLLPFKVLDSDVENCEYSFRGGWWYGDCEVTLFLNGVNVYRYETHTRTSIVARIFKNSYSLWRSHMVVRPTNDARPCDNPCQNEGICYHVADPIGHYCECTPGWGGATCELPDPCQNGGKCEAVEDPMGHHCTCTPGWCGATCELTDPCQNGAKCEAAEDPTGHHCACTPGWCGATCEETNPCKNGAKCPSVEEPMSCHCNSSWCGKTCEEINPCRNGGTCESHETTETLSCKCVAEFTGQTCEDVIREDSTSEDTTTGDDATGDDPTGENATAYQNHCRPKDCYDLKCYLRSKPRYGIDGNQTIYLDTPTVTTLNGVSCDHETDGGVWVFYQRRMDGSVPFTKTFEEYKRVFGQLCSKHCNYFLGNENLYQLLQSCGTTECELRIELYDFGGGGEMRWLVAKQFRMNNESLKYSLNWDEVISHYPELGVDWDFHKLLPFKVLDSDVENCEYSFRGGMVVRRL